MAQPQSEAEAVCNQVSWSSNPIFWHKIEWDFMACLWDGVNVGGVVVLTGLSVSCPLGLFFLFGFNFSTILCLMWTKSHPTHIYSENSDPLCEPIDFQSGTVAPGDASFFPSFIFCFRLKVFVSVCFALCSLSGPFGSLSGCKHKDYSAISAPLPVPFFLPPLEAVSIETRFRMPLHRQDDRTWGRMAVNLKPF